jgi:hypothetical protein
VHAGGELPSWAEPTAEIASNRAFYRPRKTTTEKTTILSDAKGIATASVWSRRPGTFRVTASVTNPNKIKVDSKPATVRWGHEEENSFGYDSDSDRPYYEGDSEAPYYKRHDDEYTSDKYRSDKYRSDEYRSEGHGYGKDSHYRSDSPTRYEHEEYRHAR